MNTVKKLMYRIISMVVVVGLIISSQVITTKADPIDLSDPAIDFTDILFVKREYINRAEHLGNHMCDQYFGFNQVKHENNGLYILENAFSANPKLVNVLENSYCTNGRYEGEQLKGGAFLSPNLSYDAKEIVFAYTDATNDNARWRLDTTFHIFKVNIDGTGLTQLTDGIWNDFDPVFLPDGDIMFVSERRGGYGRCHGRPVPTYTLHRMKPDGSDIRTVSYHETNEWNPSVDNNGMIIYTRWDYVDRGATHPHSAWITAPDGSDARPITLNYPMPTRNFWDISDIPLMQMSLRAIPNSRKIVGTAAFHHGQNYGTLIVIDPDVEDDDSTATITNITPDNNGYPESGSGGRRYATPYPLSEELFLCVYANNQNHPSSNNFERYGIYLIDTEGNKQLIYRDPNLSALSPIPVRPRTKPNALLSSNMPDGDTYVVAESIQGGAAVVHENRPEGRVAVANVYDTLLPFPEGTKITHLRIWQIYPKATAVDGNPRISYEQISAAGAGRNSRGLLGTVPVEEDGSAFFYMPSGRAVFFQAVDQDGTAVQTMRSSTFLVPGQNLLFCQGCHEPRHRAADNLPQGLPMALRREASRITPDESPGARPTSYPRLIQPILDAKCISCHDGTNNELDLRSDLSTHGWFTSYVSLRPYVFLFNIHYPGSNQDRVYPRTEPGIFGARASKLYHILKDGHGDLTPEELHRFVIWMDSGIAPFYGVYHNLDAQRAGQQVEPLYD